MRKLNLVLIVIFSLIGLMIVAVIVGGIFFQNTGSIGIIGGADGPTSVFTTQRSGDMDLVLDKTIPGEGIDTIELSLGFESVDIYEAEDDQFRVVQYTRNLDNSWIVSADQTGSALTISRPSSPKVIFFGFGINTKSAVELYVPAGYKGDLDIGISSGTLRIHRALTLGNFTARLSSGNVKSGSPIEAENALIKVTSGTINLEQLDTTLYEIDLSSGNVSVGSLSGSGSARLTSGTLRLDNVRIDEYLHTKLSSGTMSLALADDPSLQFSGKVSSGTIRTYFDLYYTGDQKKESFATVGEGPYKELTTQITSGTARITSVDGSSKASTGDSTRGGILEEFEQQMDDFDDEMDDFADRMDEFADSFD